MQGGSERPRFGATVERDGEWFIASSPEIVGANGQGRTEDECLASLAAAVELILLDRREDAGFGATPPRRRGPV